MVDLSIEGWFYHWWLVYELMVIFWLVLCSTIDKIDLMVYLLKYCTAGERVERCQ